MSTMLDQRQNGAGAATDPTQLESTWRDRINQAREARRPHERTWLSNLAFAAGQHWLEWDDRQKRMRHLSEMDPRYEGRELFTADRINEPRQAALGELGTDDDRPELILAQEGDSAEQIAEQINHAVAHAWDHEWHADAALEQVRSLCLDVGTAAIRVRFDPTLGPSMGPVPHLDGEPVLDPERAYKLIDQGVQLEFREINEGRTVLEPLSPFNLLPPPGFNHEDNFPWEVVVRPVLLEKVKEQYGAAAASLTEDNDIASMLGLSTNQQVRDGEPASVRGRLRGHVWLFTGFERPTSTRPKGRTVVLASNSVKLLEVKDELEKVAPDGTHRSGVHYFHWWRHNDRFFSRAFIEPLKDPQRLINRRETQNAEIIDRGMPKVFTKEGALIENPAGLPLENIELSDTSLEPHFFAGIGPGAWMYQDIEHQIDNLTHASTISLLRLGENPTNVNNYSQLSLLNENEARKRDRIRRQHAAAIAGIVEDGVYDIRRYWPAQKQILVAGDENRISQQAFEKSKIPDFFVVKPAKGSVQPRSQAAEITKVDAIWNAAVATGVVVGPNSQKWVEWYAKSLDAGQALDVPFDESDSQTDVAYFENTLMLQSGEVPQPAEHDVQPVHIPIHREALDQARAAGDQEAVQRILQHIAASTQLATTARKAWRFMDPADTNDIASDLALDEDQALRENQMLIAGAVLNPEAFQQTLAQLQSGHNPETGKPTTPTDDFQGMLERAALKPTLIENLELHMDRHGKVIKSAEFASFPEAVRRRYLTHFDLTRDLYLSIPLMPEKMSPPKINLSLREGVGATTTAQILRRAGVPEADPDTIAEEPSLAQVLEQIKLAAAPAAPPDPDGDTPQPL